MCCIARPGYFNPRSPCGERPHGGGSVNAQSCDFNPRSPCGERQRQSATHPQYPHFNPRSPCGERLPTPVAGTTARCISIHAPRAGSDVIFKGLFAKVDISIHAPRAGSDRPGDLLFIEGTKFQSTLPVRGATWGRLPLLQADDPISIHAPRAGSDCIGPRQAAPNGAFQSTLPVRGATPISPCIPCSPLDFNPRSPCGERHWS